MALIQSGKLDKRVAILRHGIVRDGHGDDVDGFVPLAEVWASVRPATGSERLQDAQLAASAPMTFWIRWRDAFDPNRADGLSPKDALQYPPATGKMFNIVSVLEIGRREGIEIAGVARPG